MEKARLTFEKGMMPDLDVSVRPKGAYEEAINFTATPNAANSIGTLTSAKGNIPVTKIPTGKLVGHTTVGEYLVAFSTTDTTSRIYKGQLNEAQDNIVWTEIYNDSNSVSKLGFSEDHPIDAIGRYENEDNLKVYWAQDNMPLRMLNLNIDYKSPNTRPAYIFDTFPNTNLNTYIKIVELSSGGTIPVGKVQYVFKLGRKNGAETVYSIPSKIVSVYSVENENVISGNDKGTDSGRKVKLLVDFTSSDNIIGFNILKTYRIQYEEKGNPKVYLIDECTLTTVSDITVIDTGKTLEELSLEEFLASSRLFYAKTIATKDNILFAANLKEPQPELNIDCRAYRFKAQGFSRLYQEDNSYYQVEYDTSWRKYTSTGAATATTGADWTSLPLDIDAINKWNDEFLNVADNYTTVETHPYYFQRDGLTCGGSGPVVSYSMRNLFASHIYAQYESQFIVKYDVKSEDRVKLGVDTSDYYFTHRPGEIYRYGITFFDAKGIPFPVKWIGDIRIPAATFKPYGFSQPADYTYANPIIIEFKVNFAAIPAEEKAKIHSFTFVRCKREATDKVVLASGITWQARKRDSSTYEHYAIIPDGGDDMETLDSDYVHPFYSPELFYNGGIDFTGSAYRAKLTGMLGLNPWASNYRGTIKKDNVSASTICVPEKSYRSVGTLLYRNMSFTIKDASKTTLTEKDGSAISLSGGSGGSIKFRNRTIGNASYHEMYGPSMGVFTTKSKIYKGFPRLANVQDFDTGDSGKLGGRLALTIDIYQNTANSIYGGNTHKARLNNVYVAATDKAYLLYNGILDNGPVPIYTVITVRTYGDTRISAFEAMTSIHDPSEPDHEEGGEWGTGSGVDRRQVCTVIPGAFWVDCYMASLRPSEYVLEKYFIPPSSKTSGSVRVGIQETTALGVERYGDKYPVEFPDLKTYNNVYSETGSYPLYYSESAIDLSQEHLPQAIVASEKKTNGELTDSWTVFKYANILDVDTAGGGINALKLVDNKLFYWQDKAVGIVSANDRYVLNEGSIGQLALGSGGVLERFDTLSNTIGCEDKRQITNSENEVYWAFNKLKRIYSFGNELVDLGLRFACNSYIANNYPTLPVLHYDKIEDELLIKLNDKVLVYDPIVRAFVGALTYSPTAFIQLPNYNFVSQASNYKWYIHNLPNTIPGRYFDVTSPLTLKTTVNDKFDTIKVFDTLNWSSNFTRLVSDKPVSQHMTTFNKMQGTTEYQTTGSLSSISPNRKERDFTLAMPRDVMNVYEGDNPDITDTNNWNTSAEFKRRLRDRYLDLTLTLDSARQAGDKFKVNYVDVNYRPSTR